jgi:hypothetical protein
MVRLLQVPTDENMTNYVGSLAFYRKNYVFQFREHYMVHIDSAVHSARDSLTGAGNRGLGQLTLHPIMKGYAVPLF